MKQYATTLCLFVATLFLSACGTIEKPPISALGPTPMVKKFDTCEASFKVSDGHVFVYNHSHFSQIRSLRGALMPIVGLHSDFSQKILEDETRRAHERLSKTLNLLPLDKGIEIYQELDKEVMQAIWREAVEGRHAVLDVKESILKNNDIDYVIFVDSEIILNHRMWRARKLAYRQVKQDMRYITLAKIENDAELINIDRYVVDQISNYSEVLFGGRKAYFMLSFKPEMYDVAKLAMRESNNMGIVTPDGKPWRCEPRLLRYYQDTSYLSELGRPNWSGKAIKDFKESDGGKYLFEAMPKYTGTASFNALSLLFGGLVSSVAFSKPEGRMEDYQSDFTKYKDKIPPINDMIAKKALRMVDAIANIFQEK